jgi:hypothetical protein
MVQNKRALNSNTIVSHPHRLKPFPFGVIEKAYFLWNLMSAPRTSNFLLHAAKNISWLKGVNEILFPCPFESGLFEPSFFSGCENITILHINFIKRLSLMNILLN